MMMEIGNVELVKTVQQEYYYLLIFKKSKVKFICVLVVNNNY